MKTSFIVFNAECINQNRDSICRLTVLPVVDSKPQRPSVFMLNPEAPFEYTTFGITEDEVLKSPKFIEEWKHIHELFKNFDLAISTADGYSAIALHNTLERLGIEFNDINYINSKSLCRKLYPGELSYNFDLLAFKYMPDLECDGEIERVAEGWTKLILGKLDSIESSDFELFLKENRIKIGKISNDGLIHSKILKPNNYKKFKKFDPSDVTITPDEENPFFGLNVVFTGKLENYTRDQARKLVHSIGGFTQEGVTKETSYLVVGVQDLKVVGEKGLSGKMKKAQKYLDEGLDIEMIDENDFIEMMFYK